MAYKVARRRGEIGVRIALGGTQPRIVGMVLGEAGRILSAGIAAGVVLSLAGNRLLSRFLFGVEPGDLPTLTVAALILAAAGIAAAGAPALRAARLDPMAALREGP
jgi:putative ABC transport system permease protein